MIHHISTHRFIWLFLASCLFRGCKFLFPKAEASQNSLPRGAPKFPVKITTTIKTQLIPGHLRECGSASGYSTPACKARSSLTQPGLQCQPARLLLRERTRRFSRRSRGGGGDTCPPAKTRWPLAARPPQTAVREARRLLTGMRTVPFLTHPCAEIQLNYCLRSLYLLKCINYCICHL